MVGRVPESTRLPADAAALNAKLVELTNHFFDEHGIRLKVRKLPLSPEDAGSSKRGADAAAESSELPLYHFVTRQKKHMTEQLLRNRCSYITDFNKSEDIQNRYSPWILQDLTDSIMEHVTKMSSDFDDPEFSGVWLSLHTHPFITESDYGSLARSKIVGWALIEVLTTNERCLKALWIHPELSATATSDLLRVFLPRVLFEAFELVAPQEEDSCPWKFFYTWLNDFDMLPRQTWLALTGPRFLGLPKHCDNLQETEGMALGHVDDGTPIGASCPCQEIATWDDWDQVLVGCTEAYLYKNMPRVLAMIPSSRSARLLDDVHTLPDDTAQRNLGPESCEEVRKAETYGFEQSEIVQMLKDIYGKWSDGRLKPKEQLQKEEISFHEKKRPNAAAAATTTGSAPAAPGSGGSGGGGSSSSGGDAGGGGGGGTGSSGSSGGGSSSSKANVTSNCSNNSVAAATNTSSSIATTGAASSSSEGSTTTTTSKSGGGGGGVTKRLKAE